MHQTTDLLWYSASQKSLNGTRASLLHLGGITHESSLDLYAFYSQTHALLAKHLLRSCQLIFYTRVHGLLRLCSRLLLALATTCSL